MKKIAYALLTFVVFTSSAYALDPLAGKNERARGMIYVKTPTPESDTIQLVPLNGGDKQGLNPKQVTWVNPGEYRVEVKMGDYEYTQNVTVNSTERTDVVVVGYGSLKVHSAAASGKVRVMRAGSGTLVAEFAINQVKTLPTGPYDLKIDLGDTSVTQNNVWVVSNTTREIDIMY